MRKALTLFYRLMPESIKTVVDSRVKQARNWRTLAVDYGQFKTITGGRCLDAEGKPIPWYTYPAIEYLDHLDFSGCDVFEYGSGNSTLWWLRKARSVHSVEDDSDWYHRIAPPEATGCGRLRYELLTDPHAYVSALGDEQPDVIVIDGNHRPACVDYLIEKYAATDRDLPMILFDNADWYPKSVALLRAQTKWLEIDFHGFGPINAYTWTTTVFVGLNSSKPISYAAPLLSKMALHHKAD